MRAALFSIANSLAVTYFVILLLTEYVIHYWIGICLNLVAIGANIMCFVQTYKPPQRGEGVARKARNLPLLLGLGAVVWFAVLLWWPFGLLSLNCGEAVYRTLTPDETLTATYFSGPSLAGIDDCNRVVVSYANTSLIRRDVYGSNAYLNIDPDTPPLAWEDNQTLRLSWAPEKIDITQGSIWVASTN